MRGLHDTGFDSDFLTMTPKTRTIKNRQIDLKSNF